MGQALLSPPRASPCESRRDHGRKAWPRIAALLNPLASRKRVATETAEERVESAMRSLFDLDGSRDAARAAAGVLRLARHGASRSALVQELRRVQQGLVYRADEPACRKLADLVLFVAR